MKKNKKRGVWLMRVILGLFGFAIILIILPLELYKERIKRGEENECL